MCSPKLVPPLWRTVWGFLKKLEIELPFDPAIPLLGIHTKETRSERDTCTPMFIAALFIIARLIVFSYEVLPTQISPGNYIFKPKDILLLWSHPQNS